MKHEVPPITDKVEESDLPPEQGYAAWKAAKIARGLAQARDRAAMIPVEQALDDLKRAR
ncbi:MAG: hypothetical protein V4459_12940 [Pseudomonadota bacterium]